MNNKQMLNWAKNFKIASERQLPNGDWAIGFDATKKQADALYKLGKLSGYITLKDILHQSEFNPKMTVREALIGAFVCHVLTYWANHTTREIKKTKTKRSKTKKNVRNNTKRVGRAK